MTEPQPFSDQLLQWWDRHGRKDLPWQQTPTPYSVWISEIMLQQTQVSTVIPYYHRFMNQFPNLSSLAQAPLAQVLHHWTGLGYYARARNIHKTAQYCQTHHDGQLPSHAQDLEDLPGIGRSTAAAILSLGLGQSAAILDGNVKRVIARVYGIAGWPGHSAVQKQLWLKSEQLTPSTRCGDYNQAMMDFGATFCTRSKPTCVRCPFREQCVAYNEDRLSDLPGKKPKKTVPIQHVSMAVLRDNQSNLYLEQRPQSGIWGGLYSFPEYDSTPLLVAAYQAYSQREATTQGSPLTHKFTHRTLIIQPVFLQLDALAPTIGPSGCWIPPQEALRTLGLAAPIKQLIQSLQETV